MIWLALRWIYSFDRRCAIALLSLELRQVLPQIAKPLLVFTNRDFPGVVEVGECCFGARNPAFAPCQSPNQVMRKFRLIRLHVLLPPKRTVVPTLMPDMQRVAI